MSTKFVCVKLAPKSLPKDCIVIYPPDFLEEIRANKGREPRGGITAGTHLRYIVGSIGDKYDPELSAYTVRPHLYEGRKYENDSQLSGIVIEMLKSQYPKVFERYLDYQIKKRPTNTKLIYYVGDFLATAPFTANGIDMLDEKDVDVYLGFKEKKTVGKPAVKGKKEKEEEPEEEEQESVEITAQTITETTE